MKLSIIIPAYNEEKRIGDTLSQYSSFFEDKRKKDNLQYRILVVINNTTDGTLNIVKQAKKKNNRIAYLDLPKGGKGYAVVEGFKDSINNNFDLIGFTDADSATSPGEFNKLIQNLGSYDGVIANRYIKGAVVSPRQSLPRIIVSRIFNLWIKSLLFLPYSDTQCGAKLFRASALKSILPKMTMSEYAFDVELLYLLRKEGLKVHQLPTVWSDRQYSKINFMKSGPKMALSIIRLRLLHSPFKGLVRIYHSLHRRIY